MKVACCAVGTALVAFTAGARAQTVSPETIYIDGPIQYGGTGCPAGSASGDISPDGTAFTLMFDQFVASVGPGIPLSEKRKNCVLHIGLHAPQGLTFALVAMEYQGYASLDDGVLGVLDHEYHLDAPFITLPLKPTPPATFFGLFDNNYQVDKGLPLGTIVPSPCGEHAVLKVVVDLSVHATGSKLGMMTIDTVEGDLTTLKRISWKPCAS